MARQNIEQQLDIVQEVEMEPMGPTNMAELEIWTRFACGLASNPNCIDCGVKDADWMLGHWRIRRDAIVAAEQEAEAARKAAEQEAEAARQAQIRAVLNAAPWKSTGDGFWTRRDGFRREDAKPSQGMFWLLGLRGGEQGKWPEGFGDPPPGWDDGVP